MTPERFEQIARLFGAIQQGNPAEREALLAQSDPETRRELESLLAERTGGEFPDQPALPNHSESIDDATVTAMKPALQLGETSRNGNLRTLRTAQPR